MEEPPPPPSLPELNGHKLTFSPADDGSGGDGSSSNDNREFTQFASLPAELRQFIWEISVRSIPDIEEIYIHQPSQFHPHGQQHHDASGTKIPQVYTGFPVAMHVNQESRYIAQKHLSFTTPSPPSSTAQADQVERAQGRDGILVPVRDFRPDLDVLYVPWEGWRSFVLLRELYYGSNAQWVDSTRHVAVDSCLATNMTLFVQRLLPIFPLLCSLRFVVAASRGPFELNSMIMLPDPVTRCRLVAWRPPDRLYLLGGSELDLWNCVERAKIEAYEAAWEAAAEATSVEERLAFERHRDRELGVMRTNIGAYVFMEYRATDGSTSSPSSYSSSSRRHDFVEIGLDSVSGLLLPIS